MINLSISINKGYSAIVILQEGRVLFKEVKETDKTVKKHYTEQYLDLFKKALFLLKTVTEQENISYENRCVMEMKCKQVVKWFNDLEAPKNHSEKFLETLKLFDVLPFRYTIMSVQKPTSMFYANEKHVKKEVFSTIQDLL
ncbi:hypothetical protein COF68_04700 [Bacillus toyonensis]|uniref:hypothetical protein n=1 Tax=Bacillus toyonensis TaxID=155322 RepID=UPI000BFD9D61|nr:hypothetical protein [Bacillus toyonensis]PHE64151.1 hypothetical protein COF68_04700 [Bacillus toyonensis]